MKKLVLSVALSLVGFSAINAAELKCDSIEAKKAFVKSQLNLSDSDVKKLPSKESDKSFHRTDSDGSFVNVWFEKGALITQQGDDEGGVTYKYSNFKLVKNNKDSLLCSVKWEARTGEGGGDSDESKFTLQQDSKGNLVAKAVE